VLVSRVSYASCHRRGHVGISLLRVVRPKPSALSQRPLRGESWSGNVFPPRVRCISCPPSVSERILRDVKECLRQEFHTAHTTIRRTAPKSNPSFRRFCFCSFRSVQNQSLAARFSEEANYSSKGLASRASERFFRWVNPGGTSARRNCRSHRMPSRLRHLNRSRPIWLQGRVGESPSRERNEDREPS
jgi:hypothetical protein